MIVHKILLGAQAGTFLPFALSRLRWMQDNDPEGVGSEKYLLNGYRIEIQQIPPVIRIIGGGEMYFEFVTSAVPIEIEETPVAGVESYKGVFVGVTVKDDKGALTHSAVIKENRRAEHQQDTSAIQRQYQVDMINEPVIQSEKKGLFESWAPHVPHTGIYVRGVEQRRGHQIRQFRGPFLPHHLRDVGFDVPHSYNVRSADVINSKIRGTADWPRASGLQEVVKVEADGSERRVVFAIYVDVFNQVAVYPITEIGPPLPDNGQNVDELYVKRATIPMPSWAYVPSSKFIDTYDGTNAGEMLVGLPEQDWKLNHLGTMMCAVAYHRIPFELDTAGPWNDDPSSTPMTEAIFELLREGMGVQSRDTAEIMPGTFPMRYFVSPGLVEVQIKIELTGTNKEDFSLALVPRTVRDGRTDEYCTMVAGYSWIDIPDNEAVVVPGVPPPLKVAKGDLITLDLEYYSYKPTPPNDWWSVNNSAASKPYAPLNQSYLSFKNITKLQELKCLFQQPVLAIDMPTLSFVTQPYPRNPDLNFSGGYYFHRFGTAIFSQLELKEIVWPDTPYPQAVKDSITLLATEDGRQRLTANAAYYATKGYLEYVKLNDPDRDRWNRDAGWTNARILWAAGYSRNFCHYSFYHATDDKRFYIDDSFNPGIPCDSYRDLAPGFFDGVDFAPITSALDDFENRFGGTSYGQNKASHMMLCPVPYWGRYCYGMLVPDWMNCCANTTFYTHPNGSYCYFDNNWLYDGNGRVHGVSVAYWDAAKVEQVIVDRVHLVASESKAAFNSSFRVLYNEAVQKILDAPEPIPPEPPKPNLQLMQKSHLRAAFSKSLWGSYQALQLKATWDGEEFWMTDAMIWNGTPAPTYEFPPGDMGGLVAISMNHFWYTGPGIETGFGAQTVPSEVGRHVRICDPIIIEK